MKSLHLSAELRLMIQMVQQEMLGRELDFPKEEIDWDKFKKACAYHGMRHMAFSANQKQAILPEDLKIKYKKFSQKGAKSNFDNVIEIKRLYTLFEKEGLSPVLLKGALYTQLLYQNRLLRESSDIDFLFKKEESLQGMQLLLGENYTCRDFGVLCHSKDLNNDLLSLIYDTQFQELHFDKKPFNVDFHWELCHQFLNYQVDLGLYFEKQTSIDFYGKKLKVTNSAAIFWSLVLHHGGKELWLKFKDLVDLMAFMETYKNQVDWELIILQAKEFKIWTVVKNGFWILQEVFDYELPSQLKQELIAYQPKKIQWIFHFWKKSDYWNKLIPRLNYEKILHVSQDEGYTFWSYLQKLYQAYILPNPFERKRLFNFPPGWGVLNFIDKVLSYVVYQLRGKTN
ncbi:nucleotidyltransferase family protein [Aquirufa sp. ROCK2-A2]